MQAQEQIAKAPRIFILVFVLGFGVCFFDVAQAHSVFAQSYPGASGQSGSGIIYLPNGIPFRVGSNYPGGLYFPSNPGFHVPSYSNRGSTIRYSSSYRNTGKVSSLIDSPSARHTKTSTTWEAPTAIDEKIDSQIESTQVDYGIDSREALNLIWLRAKQYYDGHHYEKAAKMLDQLEPLRRKDKLSLISDASIDKMRRDIDQKLGRSSFRRRSRSQYFSGGRSSQNQPVSLDSFLDPSRAQNTSILQRGRNFYP